MGWRVKSVFWGILVLGALVRLIGVTNPLLDDQGWRQADTASMALNMLGHLGCFPDVLFPLLNYDGVGPQRVELEFPFLPYLLAITWTILGWADIWGRLWAISFSLLTLWGIFECGRLIFSERVGLWATAIYAVMPLTAYYGRVVMPEPVAQAFSIWALYFILLWRKEPSSKRLFLAALLMSAAILAKLPQLMIFPVAIVSGFRPIKGKLRAMLKYCLLALFLPMLYYSWVHSGAGEASQFVSGILSDQVLEDPKIFMTQLQNHLWEGFGFPLLLLAGVGFLRMVWVAIPRRIVPLQKPKDDYGGFLGIILWCLISLIYLGAICIRIPLDYYLVPVALPLVLCAGYALDVFEDIPGFVLGVLLVGLLLVSQTLVNAPKYTWDERYLVQATWIREHTKTEQILILSDSRPMTLYYAQRYGFRLKSVEDQKAWEELQAIPGNYLVALPGSRGEEFWNRVEAEYPQVGPGVYRIEKK